MKLASSAHHVSTSSYENNSIVSDAVCQANPLGSGRSEIIVKTPCKRLITLDFSGNAK
jgi:hypothetical protein